MSVKVTLLLLGYCGRGAAGVSARPPARAPSCTRAPTAPPHLGARVRLVLDDDVDVREDLAVLLRLGHLGHDGLAAALADLLSVRPRRSVPRHVAVNNVARLDGFDRALHPVAVYPIEKSGKLRVRCAERSEYGREAQMGGSAQLDSYAPAAQPRARAT
jgi:hypothetical protein